MAQENTDSKKVAWERDFTDLTGEKDILEQPTVLKGDREYLQMFKGLWNGGWNENVQN